MRHTLEKIFEKAIDNSQFDKYMIVEAEFVTSCDAVIYGYFKTIEDAKKWEIKHKKSPSGEYSLQAENLTPVWSLVVPELLPEALEGPLDFDEGNEELEEESYEWGAEYDEGVEYAIAKVGSYYNPQEFMANIINDWGKLEEYRKEKNKISESDDDVYWPKRDSDTDEFERLVKNTYSSAKKEEIEKKIATLEKRLETFRKNSNIRLQNLYDRTQNILLVDKELTKINNKIKEKQREINNLKFSLKKI